jgi:hypothetical protein
MGSVETKPGRNPVSRKVSVDFPPSVVPSLSEALQPYSSVVVTGGSSGIGKSFIDLCGNLKPGLAVCNLSRRVPETFSADSGRLNLNHFGCDLSRPADVERTAAEISVWLERNVPVGRSLLINNSGFGAFDAFPEPNLARQLEMIDVNVRALVQFTGLMLPLLRRRGGAIMNIASTVAFQPVPYAATYAASKAFVLHWTLALDEELRRARCGVRAHAVCPGTTRTAFFRAAGLSGSGAAPAGAMTGEAVAREALRALGVGRTQVVTGWKNWLVAAIVARLPKPLAARLAAPIFARRLAPKSGAAA